MISQHSKHIVTYNNVFTVLSVDILYPLRGYTFHTNTLIRPATLLKVILLHRCFSRFLNCTNASKSRMRQTTE